ncbi:major facilitator superfamily MFS_1 (plasmid) [Paracoccus aminophilus JCM 7686]|uniref:Major facilitator superfamily MFS_1 n=2 Tax=Paracoccus aminophilus TaxID=34003 RepID=S5Y1Y0_PARAH|nr:major facilitator superfamily MFS_1 [Paracoccus aminophilus JCM 7686]
MAAEAADKAGVGVGTRTGAGTGTAPEHRQRLVIFAFLMTAMFMATLDNQIVATALPTIVGEFGQLERFGWVGSIYLLGSSAVMPVYGKLGDLFGRKYVMMAAVLIFTLGSGICALAVSMDALIAARLLQALGGGGIVTSIFAINADLFQPRERARYQSYASLMLMLASAIGPVLGGFMSDMFGWRSIFLINLPIGVLVLTGLGMMLPHKRPERTPTIDYLGAALLAGCIASLVLWADGSQLFGGLFSPTGLAVIGAGIVLAIAWVQVEKRAKEPVVPLSLFSSKTVNLLLLISMASGSIGIGLSTYFALYLQSVTGLTPTVAGLLFVPLTGGIVLGSLTAGRIMSRTGRYRPFAMLSSGLSCLCLLAISALHPPVTLWLITPLMLFHGIGIGVGQQVPLLGVQNAALRRDTGAATGAVSLTRMGGASIAISVYGAIVAALVAHSAVTLPAGLDLEKLSPAVAAGLPTATRDLIANVYAGAFQVLFLVAAGIAALAFVAAFSLKEERLEVHSGA